MRSHLTKSFRARFSKLPEHIQALARENYKLWQRNPRHPSLAFKPVGKKTPSYSVRVALGWRVLGVRHGEAMIWFWIGSHADYDEILKHL